MSSSRGSASDTLEETANRRDVSSRNSSFARTMAKKLAGRNISPNQISTFSMVFALASFVAFFYAREQRWLLVLAVVGIQGRLLCNLFDGMIAVEYKKKSPVGELYNEVPDRISDALIILGAGVFAAPGVAAMNLAWACVFLATMTAYVRVFGASLVGRHYFIGPMAKQHRMFIITVAALVNIFVDSAVEVSLAVMVLGLVVTVLRRLMLIAAELKSNPS